METNHIIMVIFVILMVIAVIWYCIKFLREIGKLNKDINAMTKLLKSKTDTDFEDIDSKFSKNESLGLIWQDYSRSLIRHNGGTEIFSPTDATEYFSYQNITSRFNMAFWQAYGGIFTGLGILGTFAGLTIGLSNIDMTATDINILKDGIGQLLSGVQTAFFTSLIGISLALIYNPIHNSRLNGLYKNIQALIEAIEHIFKRRTIEQWLSDSYNESREQTTAIKNLSDDIKHDVIDDAIPEICNRIDDIAHELINAAIPEVCEQINGQLTPLFDKIVEAVDKLGQGGNSALSEIISDKAGTQIELFAEALENFSISIKDNIATAQKISNDMNQQMLQTMQATENIIVKAANQSVEQQRISAENINNIVNQLTDTMNSFAETQKSIMAKNVQDSIATAQKISNNMNQQMLQTMQATENIIVKAANQYAEQQRASAENINNIVNQLTDTMSSFAESQKSTMNEFATLAQEQFSTLFQNINAIIATQNETINSYYDKINDIFQSTENILAQFKDASSTFEQTTTPIKNLVRQINEQFAEIQNAHNDITLQVSKIAEISRNNETLTSNLTSAMQTYEEHIKTAWTNYESNFNRVGGELERAINIITERLQKYNEMTDTALKSQLAAFDNSVANSIGALLELVEELNDALAGFQRQRG